MPERVRLREALGLVPVRARAREAWLALAGGADLPRTRFDASSLPLLMPRLSIPMWRGRQPIARRVIATNLFNHRQTPIEEGWSVRRRQIEDFRGGTLTYDSHNGTDLAIPPGTVVVAPAAGRVVRISTEFHRGGLKLVLDHGGGLLTGCAHLSRVTVAEGAWVARGEPVALSGMSGLDGLALFPWLAPHVHWNVWLGGAYVDPLARDAEHAILRGARAASPAEPGARPDRDEVRSAIDEDALARTIESARAPGLRARLASIADLQVRAGATFVERAYFPGSFGAREPIFVDRAARAPRLDLPFSPRDFDGLTLADEPTP